jgi:hypothetical protein
MTQDRPPDPPGWAMGPGAVYVPGRVDGNIDAPVQPAMGPGAVNVSGRVDGNIDVQVEIGHGRFERLATAIQPRQRLARYGADRFVGRRWLIGDIDRKWGAGRRARCGGRAAPWLAGRDIRAGSAASVGGWAGD